MAESGSNERVQFSEQALAEYREILERYPTRRAALMPVLWLAQREFGWISPEVREYVAELMELPRAWVEAVVSFYTMFYRRPMGKYHIQVCTNLSCQLRGAEEVLSAIRRKLDIEPGETTPDGKFSLDRVECLGSCGTAPVIQLGSGRYVENVSVERALALIDELAAGKEG
ncbi:MAG: NAD(P)H-dependent oxidoreductase subunit E [Candidatus Dadabacteria bacterium]|nr:MAG: NAD(P)H-dependent oxidoreductase subunit E [Candidatus Dadabacteria bacterium]